MLCASGGSNRCGFERISRSFEVLVSKHPRSQCGMLALTIIGLIPRSPYGNIPSDILFIFVPSTSKLLFIQF